jgi:hypothetical protein
MEKIKSILTLSLFLSFLSFFIVNPLLSSMSEKVSEEEERLELEKKTIATTTYCNSICCPCCSPCFLYSAGDLLGNLDFKLSTLSITGKAVTAADLIINKILPLIDLARLPMKFLY